MFPWQYVRIDFTALLIVSKKLAVEFESNLFYLFLRQRDDKILLQNIFINMNTLYKYNFCHIFNFEINISKNLFLEQLYMKYENETKVLSKFQVSNNHSFS